MTIFWINLCLLMPLLVAQVIDGMQTGFILLHGGKEANPVMAWLMARFGEERSLIVAKVGIMIALTAMVCGCPDSKIVAGIQLALLALYGWVIWHNIKILEEIDAN